MISIYAESLDKIQHSFVTETFYNLGRKKTFSPIAGWLQKFTDNLICNAANLNAYGLRIRIR